LKPFILIKTDFFIAQENKLPDQVFTQLIKILELLATNPKHPSLKTHKVEGTGGKIFEGHVNKQYRLTWMYFGSGKILLRNVDNHDACLDKP